MSIIRTIFRHNMQHTIIDGNINIKITNNYNILHSIKIFPTYGKNILKKIIFDKIFKKVG